MICNNCGTPNLEDMFYCKKCGARIQLHYNESQKNLISSFVNFKNKSNMSFFAKAAYNIITSKKKYINIFCLISTFVISLTFFIFSISGLPESFKKAIEVIYQGTNDEYYIQALWRDVWIRVIFLALSVLLMISLGLVLFRVIRFIRSFKGNNMTESDGKLK